LQTHWPAPLHASVALHPAPHEPPQPSGPHARPPHAGAHEASFPPSTAPLLPLLLAPPLLLLLPLVVPLLPLLAGSVVSPPLAAPLEP
jgi:hypothetical protein